MQICPGLLRIDFQHISPPHTRVRTLLVGLDAFNSSEGYAGEGRSGPCCGACNICKNIVSVQHLDLTVQGINDSASRMLPILQEASAAMADDERRPPAKKSFYWATVRGQHDRNGDKLVTDYGFVSPRPVPSREAITPKSKERYLGTIPEKYRCGKP